MEPTNWKETVPMMSIDCKVSWCQHQQPHSKHEQVLFTAMGEVPGLRQPRTLQAVVFGYDEHTARAAVTIVNPKTLAQESVALWWEDVPRLAAELELAAGRFRRGR